MNGSSPAPIALWRPPSDTIPEISAADGSGAGSPGCARSPHIPHAEGSADQPDLTVARWVTISAGFMWPAIAPDRRPRRALAPRNAGKACAYYVLRYYVTRSNLCRHVPEPRTTNDPTLLILTSLASGEKHGYALLQDIERFAGVTLGPGTLYGAIGRLEERGRSSPRARPAAAGRTG